MISLSSATRRAVVSSTTRRSRTTLAGSALSGSPILSATPSAQYLRRPATTVGKASKNRSLSSSSAPPSSKPPTGASSSSSSGPNSGGGSETQKTGTTELFPNMLLASVLGGFVVSVFSYSMNAVGRGDGDEDPLAQLKAEAQEARDHRDGAGVGGPGGRMTPEEIEALESGMGASLDADGERVVLDVAVAAPADIAAIEEEANLRVFRQKQQQGEEPKKKKPWWRFGF